jgi:tetratricopeptide (TPR) repeat protein
MQQNKTYAKILESQGFFEEAFVIYKKLLKQNPEDEEIKTALKRLKKIRTKFNGTNNNIKEFFIQMNENQFNEFEKWLIKGF